MFACPKCGALDVSDRTVCVCGAELALLQKLDSVADAWFNAALRALAAGQTGRALEWLAAACAARPSDAAAHRARAKVWGQLGRVDEAREALRRAAELEPASAETEKIEQALTRMKTPSRPTPNRLARARRRWRPL